MDLYCIFNMVSKPSDTGTLLAIPPSWYTWACLTESWTPAIIIIIINIRPSESATLRNF